MTAYAQSEECEKTRLGDVAKKALESRKIVYKLHNYSTTPAADGLQLRNTQPVLTMFALANTITDLDPKMAHTWGANRTFLDASSSLAQIQAFEDGLNGVATVGEWLLGQNQSSKFLVDLVVKTSKCVAAYGNDIVEKYLQEVKAHNHHVI
eukprot:1420706-Karenia_brevis.AAC.1